MRRLILWMVFALAIAMPASALAQQGPYNDKQNPNEYTDTEDGQVLKVVSYFLAPIGYALEWGVTRPLHYLATKTSLAPAMSGDTEYSQIYNPGPNVAPIVPAPPPATTASSSAAGETSARHSHIDRPRACPRAQSAPAAPLTARPVRA